MARNRLDLQIELMALPGIQGVHFDPPASAKLKYDCIVYNLSGMSDKYADDTTYVEMNVYDLTLITTSADAAIVREIKKRLKYLVFDRHFVSNGLHHWCYTLHY